MPGPSDVLAAVSGVREGITDALALVPRVGALVGRLEDLVSRVEAAVGRAEGVLERADLAIEAVGATQAKADAAIDAVAATQARADAVIEVVAGTNDRAGEVIGAVERTTGRADGVLTTAEGLTGRMGALVEDYEPALLALAPAVRRLATTLDPDEVEALVTLIDRLPQLVVHLDEDILPVLESMASVGTDVHALVDTVNDLRQIVKGFPGSRLFRRRGAEEIAQEEAEGDSVPVPGS